MKKFNLKQFNRWCIYIVGMCVLALGISLNTKAGLGVSPIISVAFCVSELLHLNFGDMTLALYVLFVVAQLFLKDKRERIAVLLQLIVSLVFSRVLNLCGVLITYDYTFHGLPMNLAVLALAICFTGAGAFCTINMHLIPNPGDGIVQAIAQRTGLAQGFTKNIFDISCVAVACLTGLIFARRFIGIGIGTLLAMLGVGRVMAAVNHLVGKKMLAAAGLL